MISSSRRGRATIAAQKIRVLIADDHVTVREGLAAIIGRQPDMAIVGQAATGREALGLWHEHRPDVALFDLRMPVLDGIGAIQEIRDQDSLARVIILTTFDTAHDIERAIKAGARGYLLKDAPRKELLDAIRKVHAGEVSLAPALVARLAAGMTSDALTGREGEILNLLSFGRSNKEIAATLEIGETTVKSHLRSIFAKLGVISRTEAIAVASQRGLVQL